VPDLGFMAGGGKDNYKGAPADKFNNIVNLSKFNNFRPWRVRQIFGRWALEAPRYLTILAGSATCSMVIFTV